ncbi:MAG: hypothetical protein CL797_03765 [Chromatiales bacterium]|jgi:hypothetical protein|nr:hypothetical protein [Chromatiales bacterium]
MTLRKQALALFATFALGANDAGAAQIPGVPSAMPPGVARQVEIFFGNDVFGDGGETDDFRTQQQSLTTIFGGDLNR